MRNFGVQFRMHRMHQSKCSFMLAVNRPFDIPECLELCPISWRTQFLIILMLVYASCTLFEYEYVVYYARVWHLLWPQMQLDESDARKGKFALSAV